MHLACARTTTRARRRGSSCTRGASRPGLSCWGPPGRLLRLPTAPTSPHASLAPRMHAQPAAKAAAAKALVEAGEAGPVMEKVGLMRRGCGCGSCADLGATERRPCCPAAVVRRCEAMQVATAAAVAVAGKFGGDGGGDGGAVGHLPGHMRSDPACGQCRSVQGCARQCRHVCSRPRQHTNRRLKR